MIPLIPALIATIAGAAIQNRAARDAQQRMESATQRSLENQRRLQMLERYRSVKGRYGI